MSEKTNALVTLPEGEGKIPAKSEISKYNAYLEGLRSEMMNQALKITNGDELASESAVSFAITYLDQKYETWSNADSPDNYAFRTLRNCIATHFRKVKRAKEPKTIFIGEENKLEPYLEVANPDWSSLPQLNEIREAFVAKVVEKLHPTYQATFSHLTNGLKPSEMGERMNISNRHASKNKELTLSKIETALVKAGVFPALCKRTGVHDLAITHYKFYLKIVFKEFNDPEQAVADFEAPPKGVKQYLRKQFGGLKKALGRIWQRR